MPVIWHQSLLAFVRRYKNELRKEDKVNIRILLESHKHKDVTPEIMKELNNSRSRGEKDTTTSPAPVTKSVEEDRFNIPEVPMEEDCPIAGMTLYCCCKLFVIFLYRIQHLLAAQVFGVEN